MVIIYDFVDTKKIIIKILQNANSKLQAAVLVVSSSGLSIEELVQLRVSDIDFTNTPTKILVRFSTSKKKIPHQTFITEEATSFLKDYLKKYFGWHENSLNLDLSDTYVFGKTSKIKNGDFSRFSLSSKRSLQISLRNHIENIPELAIKNENGCKIINFHKLLEYFRTIVGNVCGKEYAEALMGHEFYMDTYYQLSEEEKYQKYLSTEPYLTISDFQKIEQQYSDLPEKYEKLEKSIIELNQYLVTNGISILESFR